MLCVRWWMVPEWLVRICKLPYVFYFLHIIWCIATWKPCSSTCVLLYIAVPQYNTVLRRERQRRCCCTTLWPRGCEGDWCDSSLRWEWDVTMSESWLGFVACNLRLAKGWASLVQYLPVAVSLHPCHMIHWSICPLYMCEPVCVCTFVLPCVCTHCWHAFVHMCWHVLLCLFTCMYTCMLALLLLTGCLGKWSSVQSFPS